MYGQNLNSLNSLSQTIEKITSAGVNRTITLEEILKSLCAFRDELGDNGGEEIVDLTPYLERYDTVVNLVLLNRGIYLSKTEPKLELDCDAVFGNVTLGAACNPGYTLPHALRSQDTRTDTLLQDEELFLKLISDRAETNVIAPIDQVHGTNYTVFYEGVNELIELFTALSELQKYTKYIERARTLVTRGVADLESKYDAYCKVTKLKADVEQWQEKSLCVFSSLDAVNYASGSDITREAISQLNEGFSKKTQEILERLPLARSKKELELSQGIMSMMLGVIKPICDETSGLVRENQDKFSKLLEDGCQPSLGSWHPVNPPSFMLGGNPWQSSTLEPNGFSGSFVGAEIEYPKIPTPVRLAGSDGSMARIRRIRDIRGQPPTEADVDESAEEEEPKDTEASEAEPWTSRITQQVGKTLRNLADSILDA